MSVKKRSGYERDLLITLVDDATEGSNNIIFCVFKSVLPYYYCFCSNLKEIHSNFLLKTNVFSDSKRQTGIFNEDYKMISSASLRQHKDLLLMSTHTISWNFKKCGVN